MTDEFHHFDVGEDDLQDADSGLPECPVCETDDVLRLATGEYVCQEDGCHEVFADD